jgi:hypothetical protein
MTLLNSLPSTKCSSCSQEGFTFLCDSCTVNLGSYSSTEDGPVKIATKLGIESFAIVDTIANAKHTDRQEAEQDDGKRDSEANGDAFSRQSEEVVLYQAKGDSESIIALLSRKSSVVLKIH